MSVDVYSVMHNEADILPFWLRHYETIADRIFIWDDASTDGTREMLAAHPSVTFLPMPCHGDDDPCWIEKLFPMYEQYSRGQADWVIIADADEFIYHPALLDVLTANKEINTKLFLCQGYSMISDCFPVGTGQIYDYVRTGLPDRLESKWTIFSPDIYLRYRKGRHGHPIRQHKGGANRGSGIKLLHYRYLGASYFEQRDQKNIKQLNVAFGEHFTYSRNWRRTLPDKSRGSALAWYQANKDKAVDVL